MNLYSLFEAGWLDKLMGNNTKPLDPNDRKTPATVSDKDIMAMNKPAGPTGPSATGNWEHLLKHLTTVIQQYKPHKSPQEAEDEAMNFIAAENQKGIRDPKQILSDLWRDLDAMPDEFTGYVDDKSSDDLDADMKSRFDNLQKSMFVEPKIEHVSGPDERGNKIFSVTDTLNAIRRKKMPPQRLIADLVYNKIHNSKHLIGALDKAEVTTKEMFNHIDTNIELWFDDVLPTLKDPNRETWKVNDTTYYIPGEQAIDKLAFDYTSAMLTQKQNSKKYESVNESVNSHDKLVATVANYMYVKHPEIFTQHGDGYVMTVVDDVVSKWEQQDEPMQDIKAYALEVMDALGADRTNEAIATIKTDYKGHHLVNADGEEVQSYPKNVEGLKKARNTLYINNKGLNTMKQEGLNEAFEAALEKLSLNESVTINTTTTSEGDDTVTVTATNEDAYELVALLKAAGLPHKADEVEAQIVAMPSCGEQVEEELANEPTDDVMNGDMDDMNTQSGGLNRRKMQFKHSYRQGDNPMAMNEENLLRGLWDLYKEAK